tara:strand:- start:8412 stop:8702 length:291 start_codon:yes stop_codon:yes gene_type:complete
MIQTAVTLLFAAVSLTTAFTVEARKPENGKMGPPPAAIEACQSLSEKDVCTMIGKEGDSLKGTCRIVPSGEFACVPDNHKRPGDKKKKTSYHGLEH